MHFAYEPDAEHSGFSNEATAEVFHALIENREMRIPFYFDIASHGTVAEVAHDLREHLSVGVLQGDNAQYWRPIFDAANWDEIAAVGVAWARKPPDIQTRTLPATLSSAERRDEIERIDELTAEWIDEFMQAVNEFIHDHFFEPYTAARAFQALAWAWVNARSDERRFTAAEGILAIPMPRGWLAADPSTDTERLFAAAATLVAELTTSITGHGRDHAELLSLHRELGEAIRAHPLSRSQARR